MIKEGLLTLYRAHPEAVAYPVYYLPLAQEEQTIEDMGHIVAGMHSLPEIPWPEDDCVICSEDYITSLIDCNVQVFTVMLHSAKMKKRMNLIPKSDNVEPIEFFNIICQPGRRNAITSIYHNVTMVHQTNVQMGGDIDKAMKNQREWTEKTLERKLTPEEEDNWLRYLRATMSRFEGSCWIAEILGNTHRRKQGVGLASDILALLSNIVAPCHYFVRSTFENGFGSSSMRRLTKNKPIFSVIAYDRLYRSLISDDEDRGQVTPHRRRGHIRYYWQKAGLNRNALPDRPLDRFRLVHEHRVERTYIHPMWVGERTYRQSGVLHQILTGDDMPLMKLWSEK